MIMFLKSVFYTVMEVIKDYGIYFLNFVLVLPVLFLYLKTKAHEKILKGGV